MLINWRSTVLPLIFLYLIISINLFSYVYVFFSLLPCHLFSPFYFIHPVVCSIIKFSKIKINLDLYKLKRIGNNLFNISVNWILFSTWVLNVHNRNKTDQVLFSTSAKCWPATEVEKFYNKYTTSLSNKTIWND